MEPDGEIIWDFKALSNYNIFLDLKGLKTNHNFFHILA